MPDPAEHVDPVEPVCNLCGMPAARFNGVWVHAEPADALFCSVVMRGQTPKPSGDNND